MAKRHVPTEQDRLDAIRVALSGIASGRDVDGIVRKLAVLQPAKQYLDDKQGVKLQNLWNDIAPIGAHAAEHLGYPT